MPKLVAAFFACLSAICSAAAAAHPHDGTSEAKLLPLTRGEEGKLVATLPAPGEDGTALRVIHAMRLTSGLGSNPIGLDRGWGNSGEIVRFRVADGRVTAEIENQFYRAHTDNPDEVRAVEQSFARSIIYSTDVIEETGDSVTFDIKPLLMTDLLGLSERLKEDGSGGFTLDKDRSRVAPRGILTFPLNTEIDTEMTFVSSDPGREVRQTSPYPGAVTLTVHHSFVALPDDGYETREYDPRVGTFARPYYDFSAPLEESVQKTFAMRHRLTKDDPLVFYVDSGAPEPVRSALVEGAGWWAEGFAAAGFPDGYRVEVLPEGVHPLDVRYNVIQWVHRQTRGWSYGGGISDPRTGEFIKGHVILGSQRVRQDRMIFEGLAGTAKTGSGEADDPVELALARIRQLSAHEVGHALGFGHNFAASHNDRASVMDYPAPWVIEEDGALDFSRTYDAGLGPWDIATARWLYGEENGDAVIAQAREAGLLYIEDSEGRGVGTAHPFASVWDNGSDPVAELENVMRVRQVALENFESDRAAEGRSAAELRQVLVPVYLYHRYQTAAASKLIGGASYQYAKLGTDPAEVEIVPAREQRTALEAILETVSPEALDIPAHVLSMLTPRADAFQGINRRESFDSATAPVFDHHSAAEAAADITFRALFASRRLERLAQFEAMEGETLGLSEMLDTASETVTEAGGSALAQLVEARFVAALIAADRQDASIAVRGALWETMSELERTFSRSDPGHRQVLAAHLRSHLEAPAPARAPRAEGARIPPGSPIGEACWHCESF
ncbi:zinc-dependent metalloprotease [Parvularcula lutaonensis]|uniref:Zinc-dependent metalloprotease n=1 Tax=Parvularcula lutaonensis TaxID=491923 RepID=A0ABV7M9L6_9PROT|nr:zinc-dependent metalloprotease [Parvularcula lutaonensis]GGY47083.1 peptidase [Parvularcula lutaonensis]